MAITESTLKTLTQLAYLDKESDITTQLAEEISAIMDFVEQLCKVPTIGVAPLFHPLDLPNQHLRNDEITEKDCRAQLAAIAPHFEDGFYLVPKVMDLG